MWSLPYRTYLLNIWKFLLTHTYHTYLWEWSIMPYLPYLPYLLIGFHYAILTILTYGNPLCHTYHTYSWDSIMPYLPYLLMGFDFYSALACNWQTSKFDICIAQRKQSTLICFANQRRPLSEGRRQCVSTSINRYPVLATVISQTYNGRYLKHVHR